MDPTYLQAKLGNAEQTSLYWTLRASATVCRTGNGKFFLESLSKGQKALGGFQNTLLSNENSTTIGNFTHYKGLQQSRRAFIQPKGNHPITALQQTRQKHTPLWHSCSTVGS